MRNEPADPARAALQRLVERLRQDFEGGDGGGAPFYTALAETMLRDAARRRDLFGRGCLGDPAWNILLDLFIQEQRGVSSGTFASSVASGAPAATGLRYLKELERAGHVERTKDPADARRVLVRLSASARQAMITHLSTFHARLLMMSRATRG